LGKVLYELITGLNRSEFPSLPDSLYSRSDRAALFELNQVVLKACAPAPAERYANAKALLKDLLIVRSGQSLLRVQSLQRLLSFNNRFGVFNVTRFAGATILLLIMALSAGTPWRTDSIALYAAYWLFALASVVFSLSSSNARILNSYSIPVVDMPMLFVMQSTSMALAGNYLDAETYGRLTGATAGYSIAMYSLLIMLATLSVKFFQIMFAFLLAFFFQSRLCSQAGLSPVASVEAFFLLLLVSGLCYFARRHVLVRSTTTS